MDNKKQISETTELKDQHVIVDQAFLEWAKTKLEYPDLAITVRQLQMASQVDLGTLWQIYKGSDKLIPTRIAKDCQRYKESRTRCFFCSSGLIPPDYRRCACDTVDKAKNAAFLRTRENWQNQVAATVQQYRK